MAHQKWNYRFFQDMISPLPDSIFVIFVGPQDSFESLGELFHMDNKLLGFAWGHFGDEICQLFAIRGILYARFCCRNGGCGTCLLFPTTIFIQPFWKFSPIIYLTNPKLVIWVMNYVGKNAIEVRIRVNYVGRYSITIWCHGNLRGMGYLPLLPPPWNKTVMRPDEGTTVVNNPLVRPYFFGRRWHCNGTLKLSWPIGSMEMVYLPTWKP